MGPKKDRRSPRFFQALRTPLFSPKGKCACESIHGAESTTARLKESTSPSSRVKDDTPGDACAHSVFLYAWRNLGWRRRNYITRGNAHAHEAKLGCEKGRSNTEIEGCWQEGSRNEKTKSGSSKGGNYEKAAGCCRTSASRSRRSTGCPRRSAACRFRSASYERVKLGILPAGRYASLMTI